MNGAPPQGAHSPDSYRSHRPRAAENGAPTTEGASPEEHPGAASSSGAPAADLAFDFTDLTTRAVDRLARAIRRRGTDYAADQLAEQIFDDIESDLLDRTDITWRARASFEKELGADMRRVFENLDLALGCATAVMRLLEDAIGDRPPTQVAYSVLSISTRALSTSHEIGTLLRGGFPVGAGARWRTLYEANITASVLRAGNRHTCTRYNEHRWIMLARDRDHLEPKAPWPIPGPTPEMKRDQLVARFGSEYAGKYGWAAEITRRRLGVRKPQFHHLEKLAALPGHDTRVLNSHHRVHADALGYLLLLDNGQFHSGATRKGAALITYDTIRVLGECLKTLIEIWGSYGESSRTRAAATWMAEVFLDTEGRAFNAAIQVRRHPA